MDGVNGFADETLLWSGNTHPRTHGAALSRPEPLDSHTGIRIGRTRFNYEVEIATTASAPDRHSPEFGQHIWGKFNKLACRMCPVTYLLDDDIDPSDTSDVPWGAGLSRSATGEHALRRSTRFTRSKSANEP